MKSGVSDPFSMLCRLISASSSFSNSVIVSIAGLIDSAFVDLVVELLNERDRAVHARFEAELARLNVEPHDPL
jgi:hypothetical protein